MSISLLQPTCLDVKLALYVGIGVQVRSQILGILQLGIKEHPLLAILSNQLRVLHSALNNCREIGLAVRRCAFRHDRITNELPEIFAAAERLVEGGHILEEVHATSRCDRERSDFAAVEITTEFREEPLRDIHIPADQGGDAGAATLERYAQELRAGIRLDLVEDVFPHAARHDGDTD